MVLKSTLKNELLIFFFFLPKPHQYSNIRKNSVSNWLPFIWVQRCCPAVLRKNENTERNWFTHIFISSAKLDREVLHTHWVELQKKIKIHARFEAPLTNWPLYHHACAPRNSTKTPVCHIYFVRIRIYKLKPFSFKRFFVDLPSHWHSCE